MKILIVGSKGFIGSHCVKYFSNNHDVWQCDVIPEYGNGKYIYIVDAEKSFHDLFSVEKFDICINCSGAANVSYSLKNPLFDFQLNTLNVFRILDAIRVYNPTCKFVNMSSAAVYGNPTSIPIKESHSMNPISPYGYHKVYAETICKEFYEMYGLSVCCIRIFSAYGPGLRKQLLWDIYQKTINSKRIELYGTGKETRDFIFIDDLVSLIDCAIQHSNFNFDIINAANGLQITIQTVAEEMLTALDYDGEYFFNHIVKEGDPLNWEADITKAQKMGYTNVYSIKQGIKKYVEWLNHNSVL